MVTPVELTVVVTTVGLVVMAVEVPDIVSVVAVRLAEESVLTTFVVEVTAVDVKTVAVPVKVFVVVLVITCVAVELTTVEVAV